MKPKKSLDGVQFALDNSDLDVHDFIKVLGLHKIESDSEITKALLARILLEIDDRL